MVTVSSCVGTTYLSIPAQQWYEFAYLPTKEIVQPLLVFPEWMSTYRFTPGRIMTSKPDITGQKSCIHHNISGTVVLPNSINWSQKDSSYSTDTFICVSQLTDQSGKLRQYPYNKVMSLSDDYRVVHEEILRKTYSTYYYDYSFQEIHWKQWIPGVMACYRTYHYDYYKTSWPAGWKSASSVTGVVLYDYRMFPKSIRSTSYEITDSRRTGWSFTSFSDICQAAMDHAGWVTRTQPDPDGFIIRLDGITSASSGNTAEGTMRQLCNWGDFSMLFERHPYVSWNDLCEIAINDCHYLAIDSIAELRDIATILPELRKTLSLLPKIRNPKTWASIFLSYKYGLRLTIGDGKEVVQRIYDVSKAAKPLPYSVVRAMAQVSVRPTNFHGLSCRQQQWYTIYYSPYDSGVMEIMKSLQDWDLYPNFGNLWDLLPFSFVVDWFHRVDSLMDRIDANIYTHYLDVVSVTRTRKDIIDISPSDLGVIGVGTLQMTLYERTLHAQLDPPLLKLDSPKQFSNWAELSAIIVQKKR